MAARVRKGDAVTSAQMRELGAQLTEEGLPASALDILHAVLDGGEGLELRLAFESAAGAGLPWELLCARDGRFLCEFERVRLFRHSSISRVTEPIGARATALIAWADTKREHLEGRRVEIAAIHGALAKRFNVVEARSVHSRSLLRAIAEHKPEIVHFIGHGRKEGTGGAILVESDDGEALLYASDLAESLKRAGVKLLTLSACDSAGPGGIGAELSALGVPAVVGMQLPIEDRQAVRFSRALYAGLSDGLLLSEAIPYGRRALTGSDFAAPVLYLAEGAEGLRFEVSSAPHSKPPLPPPDARPFVGRVKERAALKAKIRDRGERFVVVTGLGGMGKTRLAKQVALELGDLFPHGIAMVSCEHVRSRDDLLAATRSAVLAEEDLDERELFESLKTRRMLVYFDCFEHAVHLTDFLLSFQSQTQYAHLIVTSRMALEGGAGYTYELQPLDTKKVRGADSEPMQLFAEAARHVEDGFAITAKNRKLVAEICRKLEGVPLAIVLAAGRLRVQTLGELAREIDALELTDPLATNRQHDSLRRAISTSVLLLPSQEQSLLRVLSIFVGDFNAAMSAEVAHESRATILDGIVRLSAYSLIHQEVLEGEKRFRLLDSVREYLEESASGAGLLDECRMRHAELFCGRAEEVSKLFAENRWQEANRLLWKDIGNFRAAAEFAASRLKWSLAGSLAGFLARPLLECGLWADFESLTKIGYQAGDTELEAALLGLEGAHAARQKDHKRCMELWYKRLAINRALGDKKQTADGLIDLAWEEYEHGDRVKAEKLLHEGLIDARAAKAYDLVANVRAAQGRQALASGRPGRGLRCAQVAMALSRRGGSEDQLFFVRAQAAMIYSELGHLDESISLWRTCIALALEGRRFFSAGRGLLFLGDVFVKKGEFLRAAYCLVAANRLHGGAPSDFKKKAVAALRNFSSEHPEIDVPALVSESKKQAPEVFALVALES